MKQTTINQSKSTDLSFLEYKTIFVANMYRHSQQCNLRVPSFVDSSDNLRYDSLLIKSRSTVCECPSLIDVGIEIQISSIMQWASNYIGYIRLFNQSSRFPSTKKPPQSICYLVKDCFKQSIIFTFHGFLRCRKHRNNIVHDSPPSATLTIQRHYNIFSKFHMRDT